MFFIPPILQQPPVSLHLDLRASGKSVSPSLFGLMTEEINYSYDGGLYAELVRNRAFLDDRRRAAHWAAVGEGSSISLEQIGPDAARPTSLNVQGGVANEGYWGIPVHPHALYRLSIIASAESGGPITASIESPDGRVVYAQCRMGGLGKDWRKLTSSLRTAGDCKTTKDARLVLRTGAGQTVHFAQVSLFPETFLRRPNGNRPDLMEMLASMKPQFLRFPGGNYLEGNRVADRFPWKQTLGPIETRPGHPSPWGYRSSDGMGLLEFLQWSEDMGAKPVLAVFAGYALNGEVVKAGPGLDTYVQEALDEIEYVIGGPETTWGKRRAADGHPKPFPLECVEVGNEDGFDKSGSYEGRFVQFYDAIKAKYPNLKVIATTGGQDWLGAKFPLSRRKPDLVDEHYYASDWDMMAMASKYDTYDRKGPEVFVGEWASQGLGDPWTGREKKGPMPDMASAVADAAFMTGLERNSDIVKMACYAPLLVNLNPGGRQWAVNLIGYDALSTVGSPSYLAQKLFMTTVGDHTVAMSLSNVPNQTDGNRALPGVFASATRDSKHKLVYIKLVNALSSDQTIEFEIQGASVQSNGSTTTLHGAPRAVNALNQPLIVVPEVKHLTGLGSMFRQIIPALSVTVLTLHCDR